MVALPNELAHEGLQNGSLIPHAFVGCTLERALSCPHLRLAPLAISTLFLRSTQQFHYRLKPMTGERPEPCAMGAKGSTPSVEQVRLVS
jgi:hypothetical protein